MDFEYIRGNLEAMENFFSDAWLEAENCDEIVSYSKEFAIHLGLQELGRSLYGLLVLLNAPDEILNEARDRTLTVLSKKEEDLEALAENAVTGFLAKNGFKVRDK